MNLPETCCLSIQGPANLLDLGGFHWGDDIIFDSTSGGIDSDAGFKKTTELLKDVVDNVLIEKCGYKPRDIFFFGFGQGGMAASNFAGMPFSSWTHSNTNILTILKLTTTKPPRTNPLKSSVASSASAAPSPAKPQPP